MSHPGLAETAIHRQGLWGLPGADERPVMQDFKTVPQICANSRTDKTGQRRREPDKFKLIRASQPSEPCRRQALSRFIVNIANITAFSNEPAPHRDRDAGTGSQTIKLRSSRRPRP